MKLITIILLLFLPFNIFSQASDIDMTKIQSEIDEYGVPTVGSVDQMLINADRLYDNRNWQEAADAYALFAKNANWLANLLSSGLEPYYSASYDDKKNINYSIISPLVQYETKANYYKSQRNKAILRQGVCFYNMNDHKTSLTFILKALDLIGIKDTDQWKEAREILYSIVKY